MPIKKFCISIAARAGFLKSRTGQSLEKAHQRLPVADELTWKHRKSGKLPLVESEQK